MVVDNRLGTLELFCLQSVYKNLFENRAYRMGFCRESSLKNA